MSSAFVSISDRSLLVFFSISLVLLLFKAVCCSFFGGNGSYFVGKSYFWSVFELTYWSLFEEDGWSIFIGGSCSFFWGASFFSVATCSLFGRAGNSFFWRAGCSFFLGLYAGLALLFGTFFVWVFGFDFLVLLSGFSSVFFAWMLPAVWGDSFSIDSCVIWSLLKLTSTIAVSFALFSSA